MFNLIIAILVLQVFSIVAVVVLYNLFKNVDKQSAPDHPGTRKKKQEPYDPNGAESKEWDSL